VGSTPSVGRPDKRVNRHRLLILACGLWAGFFSQLAAAAGPGAPPDSPYAVDVWDNGDGLPQNSIIAMVQGRDGYLWLGTLNGLVRFDGDAFTCFNVNNTPGLPSDRIIFLFEDRRQTLWVGTENAGLCAVRNGVVQAFDTGGEKITCASEDPDGTVWFSAANGGLVRWRNGRLDPHPADFPPALPLQLLLRSTHELVPGPDGGSWQLRPGHVTRWQGERLEKDFGSCPWTSTPIQGVMNGRIISLDAAIRATAVDRAGNLAVGTDDGVFWIEPSGAWHHLSTEQGLSYKNVLSLCFDREGGLWVGTDGGGLDRVKRKLFTAPPELHPGVAQSVAIDAQGGLWVAFNRGGLSYVLTNAAQDFPVGGHNNAWAVLADRRGQVWAGTRDEGLFRLASGHFESVGGASRIGPQIFALLEARDGSVWAGGQNGLGRFDGQGWTTYSAAEGLSNSTVRALAEDAGGDLWIGTESGGLFRWHAGNISAVHAPVKDISCLLADADAAGGLWVGTSGHGLARLQNGGWRLCSTLNGGLAADDIGYLVPDAAGNLWVGTYEGLLRVEKQSLADFAAGAAAAVSCRTFLARECSAGAQPAALRAPDGKLWFPTVQGLVTVDPAGLRPDTNPPPVVIESVRVDGAEQKTNRLASDWTAAVRLAPENERLEIRFTALNFSAPKQVRSGAHFRFRLEHRDKHWTDIGGERVVHFNRLAPGSYVFRVTACNEDGVWNDAGAALAVTVLPPFWQRPGFVAAAIVVLLAALAGAIYLVSTAKLKRQLRVLRQKELIEQERARIARDLHDQIGANLTQVTLLGELAETDKALPAEVEQHAQQICATARETTRSLDEIVWSLNPANDTLEGLANYACKYAQDYFALAGVSYRADLPPHLPPAAILPEVRHNVFLAFKEAVNNVVKHAQAREARVALRLEPGKFILEVADNGRGPGDLAAKKTRNGLKNMRKRLADLRGEFTIAPGPAGGTVVTFTVPLSPH
jgi:ligand-binding sensor domain-containing protein/signal transduction histidine kinase